MNHRPNIDKQLERKYGKTKKTLEATKTRRRISRLVKEVQNGNRKKIQQRIRWLKMHNPITAQKLGITYITTESLIKDPSEQKKFQEKANEMITEIKVGNLKEYHTERVNDLLGTDREDVTKDKTRRVMEYISDKKKRGEPTLQ